MAIIDSNHSLFNFLKSFKKPCWGTCAGAILLANKIANQAREGQANIGGMDMSISRNFFGRQVQSFEQTVTTQNLEFATFPGVFIRAPAIQSLV